MLAKMLWLTLQYLKALLMKGSVARTAPIKLTLAALVVGSIIFMPTSGCDTGSSPVGTSRTERQSVELEGATAVAVSIDMATGKLILADGSSKLMDATFQYNIESWKPQVSYEVSNSEGKLSIIQPVDRANMPAVPAATVYDWDLRLGADIPVSLDARLGDGEATLSLATITLKDLEMVLGAGPVEADISGDYLDDLDVRIMAGTGNLTLRLPTRVATRVTINGNLGKVTAANLTKDGNTYTNNAQSPQSLNVTIESGLGEILLEGPR